MLVWFPGQPRLSDERVSFVLLLFFIVSAKITRVCVCHLTCEAQSRMFNLVKVEDIVARLLSSYAVLDREGGSGRGLAGLGEGEREGGA